MPAPFVTLVTLICNRYYTTERLARTLEKGRGLVIATDSLPGATIFNRGVAGVH